MCLLSFQSSSLNDGWGNNITLINGRGNALRGNTSEGGKSNRGNNYQSVCAIHSSNGQQVRSIYFNEGYLRVLYHFV